MSDGHVVIRAGMMLARRKARAKEMVTDAGGFHWTNDIQAAVIFRNRSAAGGAAEIVGGSIKRTVGGRIL